MVFRYWSWELRTVVQFMIPFASQSVELEKHSKSESIIGRKWRFLASVMEKDPSYYPRRLDLPLIYITNGV